MSDIGDGRANIWNGAAVGQSGRSQISRRQNKAGRFEPIAAQTKEDVWITLQPAHFRAKRYGSSGPQGVGKLRANAVGTGIAAADGAQMERTTAAVALGGFPTALIMIALKYP